MLAFNKKQLLFILLTCCSSSLLFAQVDKKTIDVTSSFKPTLIKPTKPSFSPTPFLGDTTRTLANYNIPSQNLQFQFVPSSLRPLAYEPDSLLTKGDRAYIKAGFGNFKTAHVQALATFGDGENSNGLLEGYYDGSTGKLPFQKYSRFGAKVNNWSSLANNMKLNLNAEFNRYNTNRYGYMPTTLDFNKKDLELYYNDLNFGAAISNPVVDETGIIYHAGFNFTNFSDNYKGAETSIGFDGLVAKSLSEKASLNIGLNGMVGKFKGPDTSFNNNLVLLPVNFKMLYSDELQFNIGIIPSWNNSSFSLLPNINFDYLINNGQYVFQGGFTGSYQRNTYKSLAKYNPWIAQPTSLGATRQVEFFGALKAVVDESLSFRIKAGFGKQFNTPLFVNDDIDGKSFNIVYEPTLTNINVQGELIYQQGQAFSWTNSLKVNSYTGLENYDKVYGLLPMEFNSNLRAQLVKDLTFKADLYAFSGTWYQPKAGGWERGKGAFDVNAGLEFALKKNLSFWLDFRNITNSNYQRWQQYEVIGFQVLGGVVFRL